jgi:hypothetical protein
MLMTAQSLANPGAFSNIPEDDRLVLTARSQEFAVMAESQSPNGLTMTNKRLVEWFSCVDVP